MTGRGLCRGMGGVKLRLNEKGTYGICIHQKVLIDLSAALCNSNLTPWKVPSCLPKRSPGPGFRNSQFLFV